MRELGDVRAAVKPTDTLLVVDAMTGQEAAGLVKSFNDAAEITGASLAMPELSAAALSLRWHISIVVQFAFTMQGPCTVTLEQLPLLPCGKQQLWVMQAMCWFCSVYVGLGRLQAQRQDTLHCANPVPQLVQAPS